MGAPRQRAGAVAVSVAALGRHQLAREHGAVVLSVLADDDARQAWRQYLAGVRRAEIVATGDIDSALAAWIAATDAVAIADAARAAAAAAAAVPAGSLTAHFAFRGARQRDEWIADWALTPALRLAAWLCQAAADGERVAVAAAPQPRGEIASALAGWLGSDAPGLSVNARGGAAEVATAARCAAGLAHVLPTVPVALTAPQPDLAAYLEQAAESTSKALVRQGVVGRLDPSRDDEPGTRALGRDPMSSSLASPATPASAGTAALFAAAPGLDRSRAVTDPDEPGRSAAERSLHAALEADARTRGCFAAGASVDVDVGGKPAPIDLLAVGLRLAIEVDGYFHVRDADAYRRDRQTDVVLQRHGYLVMRYLADDVVARTDEIVDAIAEAVAHRRQGAP